MLEFFHRTDSRFTLVNFERENGPGHFSIDFVRYDTGDVGLPEHLSLMFRPGSGIDLLFIVGLYFCSVEIAAGYWRHKSIAALKKCAKCGGFSWDGYESVRKCFDPLHDRPSDRDDTDP